MTDYVDGWDYMTLLPFPNFKKTAAALDDDTLSKQRCDILRLLHHLVGKDAYGTAPPPASLCAMWRGNEYWLAMFGLACCSEWRQRGKADSILNVFRVFVSAAPEVPPPHWLGDKKLHDSHKSALIRRNNRYYRMRFRWETIPDNIPIYWPFAQL